MEIKDNTFLRQFEAVVNNVLLAVEYSIQERKIFLTRLNVPEGFTNENVENELLKRILDDLEEKNMKVVPTAPRIVGFFRRNPSYKSLLPPGIVF